MIGKTIGRYQIIDKLGEGGMGTVFKAEDTTLNRMVALKSLSSHLVENEEAKERFVREAQAASALNHNNITTVYDLLEDEEQHFICMEYVDGKTLRDLVASGRVSVKKAVDIILQTAEALEAAHEGGILHRDIKSANIMVNEKGRVKVMDFGLAHLEERSQLTRTGTTMGTLSYASPEQVSGRKVDARSEIFSLGVVSYELLTGQLPFTGISEAETVLAIISGEAKPISEHRGDVSDSLEAMVSRMIQKDPVLRYQNCSELISDLKTIEAGLETSTMPITAALSATRTARRKALAVRIAAGAAVMVIALMAGILLARGGTELNPNRVVVESFQNRTGDESLDILGSLAAAVITRGIFESKIIGAVPFEETERMTLAIAEHGTPEERSNPLLATAEAYRAGTAITGYFSKLNEATIEFSMNITDIRTGNYLLLIDPVSGSYSDHQGLLTELHKNVMGALAIQFDPEFSSFAEITSMPPSLDAFREFRDGLNDYLSSNRSPTRALSHFLNAARLDTSYLTPLIWAARCYLTRYTEESMAVADSILNVVNLSPERLHPLDQHMFDWLYSSLYCDLEKQYQAAVAAAKLAPGTMWSFDAGQTALVINRPREALVFYSELDPESAVIREGMVYSNLVGWTLPMVGEYKEALKLARSFRKRRPDSWNYIWSEFRALAPFGKVKKIKELYEESLGLTSSGTWNSGRIMRWAGVFLRRYSYLDEAKKVLEIAHQWYENEQGEDKKRYRENIAEVLYLSEQWEEARSLYEELIIEAPDNLNYHGYLGCLAARRGDLNEAQSHSDWLEEYAHNLIYTRFKCDRQSAYIAAQSGQHERAFELLRESVENGLGYYFSIPFEMDLEPLWEYPPFQEWMRPKG